MKQDAIDSNQSNASPSEIINTAITQRDKAVLLISSAMSLIESAQKMCPENALESTLRYKTCWYKGHRSNNVRELTKSIDKSFWRHLLDKTSFGVTLNSTQFSSIAQDIERNAPPLDKDVALPTFLNLYEKRKENFHEGIVTVFKYLHSGYRSHSSFKIQRRVILKFYQRKYFNDMWHYFCLLDGVDPTAKAYEERPENIISANPSTSEFDFGYFRVNTYQCGNWHVWFDKRPDLVDRINKYIASYYGKTLADDRANTHSMR